MYLKREQRPVGVDQSKYSTNITEFTNINLHKIRLKTHTHAIGITTTLNEITDEQCYTLDKFSYLKIASRVFIICVFV